MHATTDQPGDTYRDIKDHPPRRAPYNYTHSYITCCAIHNLASKHHHIPVAKYVVSFVPTQTSRNPALATRTRSRPSDSLHSTSVRISTTITISQGPTTSSPFPLITVNLSPHTYSTHEERTQRAIFPTFVRRSLKRVRIAPPPPNPLPHSAGRHSTSLELIEA
jgi:hypothetical protein